MSEWQEIHDEIKDIANVRLERDFDLKRKLNETRYKLKSIDYERP